MWAKTLLETTELGVLLCCIVLSFNSLLVRQPLVTYLAFLLQEYDARSSGSSSPDSIGSVETSISSHFGGMNYPSLFSSKPSAQGSSHSKVCEVFHQNPFASMLYCVVLFANQPKKVGDFSWLHVIYVLKHAYNLYF